MATLSHLSFTIKNDPRDINKSYQKFKASIVKGEKDHAFTLLPFSYQPYLLSLLPPLGQAALS